tara:strand:+ start:338 stop:553 length:216 start_codon:yes stop_codon:yes gene_type:complete
MGIFFSKKYITIRAIKVATINGGMAILKSLSLLKYIMKKTSKGPKSAKTLIIGLYIKKRLTHVATKGYFFY